MSMRFGAWRKPNLRLWAHRFLASDLSSYDPDRHPMVNSSTRGKYFCRSAFRKKALALRKLYARYEAL